MRVTIAFSINDQLLLDKLQLVDKEHQDNGDDQGDKGGVKRHAQALGDAGDVAGHGLVGPGQGRADAAHRADKAHRGDGPGNIADGGQDSMRSPSSSQMVVRAVAAS